MVNKPLVGVSACLVGQEVRYDGHHKLHTVVANLFNSIFELIPVCPESESGMGIPREPVHLSGNPDNPKMVGNDSGQDWTTNMESFARQRVRELAKSGLDGFVLKARSPSCGIYGAELEDSSGTITRDGVGMFVLELQRQLPELPLIQELELDDAKKRHDFVERVQSASKVRTD